MRKNLLLTALCITGTMMLTSCEQIKDFFEEEDGEGGGTTEKVDLNYGLDAYFAFEGTLENSVKNGITATRGNDITFVKGTKEDTQAAKFNREKNSSLNISKAMIGGKNWTISFWGKDLYDGSIFHALDANEDQLMSLSVEDGKLRFVDTQYMNGHRFYNVEPFRTTTINDGQWHHIVLTAFEDTINGGNKINLYIDNEYSDQKQYSKNEGMKFVLGGAMTNSVNATNMSIDNLRVYGSRAINKKEIDALYQQDKPNYIAETPNYVVPQSLYTYYTFENNLNDITENNIYGSISGTANYVPGVFNNGNALTINGTDDNKMVIPNPLIDTRKWSVSFWCKDLSDGHIFSIYTSSNDIMTCLASENGKLKLVADSYMTYYQYDNIDAFITPTLNDGQWHHIVLCCDYTNQITKKLYVDGAQTDIQTQSGGKETGTKFILGGLCDRLKINAASFTIDNLRVYDTRLLSAEEIQALYQAGE